MHQPSVTPRTAKNVALLRVKPHASILYSASIITGAAGGFLIAYSSNTDPAAGEALDVNRILGIAPVAANSFANLGGNYAGDNSPSGIVLLFSTNIDTFAAPASAALFMRAAAQ